MRESPLDVPPAARGRRRAYSNPFAALGAKRACSWFLDYPAYLVLIVQLRDHDFGPRLIHGVKEFLDFFGAHSRLQNGAASKDNTEQCLAHETFDGHLSSGQMNVCRNLQTNANRLATRMCKMARRTAVLV